MEPLKISLVKTVDYEFIPFGRFLIKWDKQKKANRLSIGELNIDNSSRMPYTESDCKTIQKFMVKHKTDILTDSSYEKFYTILGDDVVEIKSTKILAYLSFLNKETLTDTVDNFTHFVDCYTNIIL